MNKYKIENKYPIGQLNGLVKYPFAKMKVGDSFWYSANEKRNVASAASVYGKKHDMGFSTRTNKKGGRIWRIK